MSALPYRPYPTLRNGHLQTMMVGLICGIRPPYNATARVIDLHDGESIVVHEENNSALSAKTPLVILVHGLGGDHRSSYLERLAPSLSASGFRVWRLDLRGCGAGVDHAWRPANAGRSDDLAQVVNAAARIHKDLPIYIVGFSLSGNILLKMLGETGSGIGLLDGSVPLQRCIAVAPPANLHHCANNMDRLSRKVYTRFYLKMLDKQVEQKRVRWSRWNSVPKFPAVKTIRQFDARYTAPLSGFVSTDEYYSTSSSVELLKHVNVHTEIVLDKHDPIVTYHSLDGVEMSPEISITRTQYGGHMGYFGIDENAKMIRWLEYYVLQRLKAFRRVDCS